MTSIFPNFHLFMVDSVGAVSSLTVALIPVGARVSLVLEFLVHPGVSGCFLDLI